jgi:hypothetical protein
MHNRRLWVFSASASPRNSKLLRAPSPTTSRAVGATTLTCHSCCRRCFQAADGHETELLLLARALAMQLMRWQLPPLPLARLYVKSASLRLTCLLPAPCHRSPVSSRAPFFLFYVLQGIINFILVVNFVVLISG